MAAPENTESRKLPKTLSPSSISTYISCPKQFEFSRIDRIPDPPGRAQLLGTFAHMILEDFMGLDPELRTPESAKRIARAQWGGFSGKDDFVNLGLDDTEELAFRWEAWGAVEGYFEMEDPKTIDIVGREKKVSVTLGDVPMFGIVDRIERSGSEMVVSDYKTGKARASKYMDETLMQPFTYAAMLAEAGTGVDRVRLLYVTAKKEVAAEVKEESIASARQRASDTWGSIQIDFENGKFEPHTGPLCDWCAYKSFCPAWA